MASDPDCVRREELWEAIDDWFRLSLTPSEWNRGPIEMFCLSEDETEDNKFSAYLTRHLLKARVSWGDYLAATARYGGKAGIEWLFTNIGLSVLSGDWLNETVLHHAAAGRQAELCRWLIEEKGDNANRRSEYPNYALHKAVREKHLPTIRTLVQCGASTEVQDGAGFSPLALGIYYPEVVHCLLYECGADPNSKQYKGMTALEYLKKDSPKHKNLREIESLFKGCPRVKE